MFEPFRFSGHVENNVVIPDGGVELPEGARAEVHILDNQPVAETAEARKARILEAHQRLFEAAKDFRLPKGFVFHRDLAYDRET